jgi:hypothetical protein
VHVQRVLQQPRCQFARHVTFTRGIDPVGPSLFVKCKGIFVRRWMAGSSPGMARTYLKIADCCRSDINVE